MATHSSTLAWKIPWKEDDGFTVYTVKSADSETVQDVLAD